MQINQSINQHQKMKCSSWWYSSVKRTGYSQLRLGRTTSTLNDGWGPISTLYQDLHTETEKHYKTCQNCWSLARTQTKYLLLMSQVCYHHA